MVDTISPLSLLPSFQMDKTVNNHILDEWLSTVSPLPLFPNLQVAKKNTNNILEERNIISTLPLLPSFQMGKTIRTTFWTIGWNNFPITATSQFSDGQDN